MRLDPALGALDRRFVKSSLGSVAALLILSFLSGCGSSDSKQPAVASGSTTTCVPMGNSFSCSCTTVPQVPPKGS